MSQLVFILACVRNCRLTVFIYYLRLLKISRDRETNRVDKIDSLSLSPGKKILHLMKFFYFRFKGIPRSCVGDGSTSIATYPGNFFRTLISRLTV
jgi:hypothetical protein